MASLQSAAAATPSPSESKGYDPEITDIANYVHNKPIDSELAVSLTADRAPNSRG
jgi:2-methylcitrate dehydratase